MAMLIRVLRATKVAPDGFTIVALRKHAVYQVPDEIGRGLIASRDAVAVDANAHKHALPRGQILAGRPAPAGLPAAGVR